MKAKWVRSLLLVCILISSLVYSPVTVAHALSFPAQMNKSFTPISIMPGATSILSVTIFNPNSFPLTAAHFHDFFPAGITLANPVNLTTTNCGSATVTDDSFNPLAPGGTMFRMDGGTVPPQVGITPGSCTVTVTVTSTTPGNLINTIPANELTSNGDDGGTTVSITNTDPASATLQVGTVLAPSLNKNFNPSTVWVGQASQLTINIINNDPTTTLTQATYTDTLPAPFVVATPLTFSLLNCGAGTLPGLATGQTSITLANATIAPLATCRVQVNVTSPTQGIYTNTIPAGPGGPGSIHTQQGVTNASPATANINVQAVGITKAFTPGTFQAGGTSLLTITLQNPTGAAYTGVGLADTLPSANLTFVAGSAATTCSPGTVALSGPLSTVTLTNGTVPAGSIITPGSCTITAQVTGTVTSTYTNNIPANTMTGPITNVLPASANVTIQARSIIVAKAFVPNNFNPGGTSTLTITLTNRYSTPYTDVQFQDTLPGGGNLTIAGVTSNSCGGTLTATVGTFVIRLGTGALGTGGTIPIGAAPDFVNNPGTCTIVVTVTSSTAATYNNSILVGAITSAQGISNTAAGNGTVTVNAAGPVTLAKAFQTSPILPGNPTRLRITVTAPADTGLTGLSVSDALPGDLHIVGTASVPPAPANPVTTCVGATLTAVIGTQSIQLTGGSIAAAGGNCTITVYVTSITPGSYPNTIPANNVTTTEGRTNTNPSNTATLLVTSLTVSKAFFPTTVNPNGSSTLTITLQNTTSSPLINVSLTDTLPGTAVNGVRIAATPNASTTCGSGVITAVGGAQIISMANGAIPAQVGAVPGICTITVNVQGRGVAAAYTNTIPVASVLATVQSTGTIISPTAQATAILTIAPISIGVVKGFNPLTVFGGSGSTLSVQLINPNNVPLTGITFTDTMPFGMIIANPANLNVGTCGGALSGLPGAGSFSFSGGSLAASTSCTLTLSATMTVNGNLTNTILAGAVTTFNGASNPQDASATLTNLPGASISKFFAPNPIFAGSFSSLTITIQNTGNVALSGMGLVDNLPGTLPAGLSVAGGAAPAPVNNCGGTLTASVGSQTIQLVGGSLGASSSCTIVISVTSTVAGNYLNTIPTSTLTDNEGATNQLPASDTLVVQALASLGDFVWNDLNANGIQDAGEPGIPNVTVHLLNAAGTSTLATTTTDAGGLYSFTGLTPGTYRVGFVPPAGYTVSPPDQGANDAVDSDANTATGITTTSYTLISGDNNTTVDAGMYQPAALGDFVWNDVNANGIQDAGETGIPNVTVHLLDATGTTTLATTTTDAGGLYSFTGLTPGTYRVGFVPPAGYNISPADQGANDAVDSDANTVTGITTASYTLVSGDNNTTVDAGLYQPASLGDFVWNDLNANGIQDAGEPGIPNVTVHLLNAAGTSTLATTTTDASGLYRFTGLTPGTYRVGFVLPAGDTFSPANQGANDAVDSDANTATGITTTSYTLAPGENNTTVDAGIYQPASIGDFVWNDLNANGIQDAGEPGIPNVTVNLLDTTGATLATTTTDAGGLYSFTGLTPGTYRVEFVPPAGDTFSPANVGADDAVDSDANTVTGRTGLYTLVSGDNNTTVDAGLFQPAALGDFVWNDVNANGIQDAGEPGIPNVTVHLLNAAGTSTLATTTTDAGGLYSFTGLTPGTYRVGFVLPAGDTFSPADQGADDAVDSDANTVTGITTASYTLVSGDNNTTVDAGIYQPASIGDFVWNDLNANGIQDAGEPGIPNVTVHLLDATGAATLDTTTTNASGLYSFTNLTPGTYRVGFVLPAGDTFSPANVGANDAVDSDANTVTGITTASYTLAPGENNITVDAGINQPAALGDFVWNDLNANGIQDAGEPGIPNVTVNLLDTTGATLATTTTDAGGLYSFTGLTPGTYRVEFVPPAGDTFSPANVGADDAVDSDANTVTGRTGLYTLVSGDNNTTVDAGLFQPAALGDFVWNDVNANGIQDAGEPGIPNVTVHLLNATGTTILATTTTNASGLYSFTGLTPGTYRVGFVLPAGDTFSPANQGADDTVDSDANTTTGITTASYTLAPGDNNITVDAGIYQPAALGDFVWSDVNGNGIQDAGEAGIPNITVHLLDATGTTTLATTTTNASGLYSFTNLTPGTYRVGFVLPAGDTFSPADQGANDAVDSDANTVTGITTASYTLAPGDNNTTVDAGIYQPAALGDFVWNDLNANGIQDAGEAGIPNVSVNLLDATGTTTLGTTTTNASGLYSFTNLTPGTYRVEFVPPAGYVISPADQGANDAVDSDANTVTGITTTSYTLAPGDNNITVDAGLYQPKAGLFDPPFGQKVLSATQLPELEWRMVWINNTNITAINVQITDPIPTGTTYVLNSLTCVANNASVTISCLYDPVLNQIFWQGHIAPDLGVTDPANAVNSVVITFRVSVPDNVSEVNNQGSSLTDTNGDGSFTDETTQSSVAVSNVASWSRSTTGPSDHQVSEPFRALPKTGFAPGVMTILPPQPSNAYSAEGDLWLEVPRLGLRMSIVGVPFSNGSWDVTWISNQAGWLQGTAFPTHAGNSVLTGHVYKADGTAGPFINLHTLRYGDQIIVHFAGQSYIYEVRDDKVISPNDLSAFKHETYPWLTLLTCKDYDAATNTYAHRVAVRAVLIKIENDAPSKSTGNKR